ncbi:MAG: GNAT family N-acetyltransferase [Leptolyngbya sp. SIO4C1]|nr:GNAT family N-acetyltransferase [Leptolyngbya sp. SIO4C1]
MSSVINQDNRPVQHQIRTAKSADLPQLTEILVSSFYPQTQLNRWVYPLIRIGIREDLKLRLANRSHQYCCLVAVCPAAEAAASSASAQIIGTVELSVRAYALWPPFQARHPYVANLAVRANYRRRGAARQLLRACEDVVRTWGYSSIYLHAAASNDQALQLYQQLDYRPRLSAQCAFLRLASPRVLLSKSLG